MANIPKIGERIEPDTITDDERDQLYYDCLTAISFGMTPRAARLKAQKMVASYEWVLGHPQGQVWATRPARKDERP